jgi:hypothetical protein
VFLGCTIPVDSINKLSVSDKPHLTLQMTVSLSDLGLRFLAGLLFAGGKNFFLTVT